MSATHHTRGVRQDPRGGPCVAFVAALFLPLPVMMAAPEEAAPPKLARSWRRGRAPATLRAWVELPAKLRTTSATASGCAQALIRWNARLQVEVLGVSSSPEVIIGRDGWLYFAGEWSVEDYRALLPFTPPELERFRAVIEQWRVFLIGARHPVPGGGLPNK